MRFGMVEVNISNANLYAFMELLESELGVSLSVEESGFIIEGIQTMIEDTTQKVKWED
jgi:hypothetical protein